MKTDVVKFCRAIGFDVQPWQEEIIRHLSGPKPLRLKLRPALPQRKIVGSSARMIIVDEVDP